MELTKVLRTVEMFAGLTPQQLEKVANIFTQSELMQDEVLFSQGDEANHLYLVCDGFVEVIVGGDEDTLGRTVVNLGPGQSVGEMALIDSGRRSATVRSAIDYTLIASVSREEFEYLCENDTDIGYRVMRNIAADLSFRLRRQTG